MTPLTYMVMMLGLVVSWERYSTAAFGKEDPEHVEVIILGAGVAGLMAAETLSQHGIANFLILEGSNRIGGRIKSGMIGNKVVEVGASTIRGNHRNPMYDLAKQYGLAGTVSNKLKNPVVRDRNGKVSLDEVTDVMIRMTKAMQGVRDLSQKIHSGQINDISYRTGLQMSRWNSRTPVEKAVEIFHQDFNFGNIPDVTSVHAKEYASWNEGRLNYAVTDHRGLHYIVRKRANTFLSSKDPRLRLKKVVSNIDYSGSKIIVTTEEGETLTADYAVVTFSLGVLKHNLVEFQPPLPNWKRDALFRFRMEQYIPIFLKFPNHMKRFWDNNEYIIYADEKRGYYPVWQNMEAAGFFSNGSNILSVKVFGEEADRIALLTDSEIVAEAMAVLGDMYRNSSIVDPEEVLIHRWKDDPLFMGSFTNWPPDFVKEHSAAIQLPVGRLYFAGEAYHEAFSGSLQGAFLSGRRNANWIIDCKMGDCNHSPVGRLK